MSSSAKLADAILSGFAGPRAFVKFETVPQTAPAAAKPASKFSPYRDDIDEGLRRLCSERKPNETFSQDEIAKRVGCHRKLIQIIEKRAYYKFVRRLLEIDPDIAEQSLGDLVTMEDVLRIHHPASTKSSARKQGDFDWRLRARRARKITNEYNGPRHEGVISLEETIKVISARKPRLAYGRKLSEAQLAEIRAERMRRQKAEQTGAAA